MALKDIERIRSNQIKNNEKKPQLTSAFYTGLSITTHLRWRNSACGVQKIIDLNEKYKNKYNTRNTSAFSLSMHSSDFDKPGKISGFVAIFLIHLRFNIFCEKLRNIKTEYALNMTLSSSS